MKQTVENRRPLIMGDVAILLLVHFNFIIQLWNMFFSLPKSIPQCILSQLHVLFIEFYSFCVCFSKICIRIQWYVVSSVFWKKLTFVPFHYLTLLVRCEEIGVHIIYLYLFLKSTYWEYILEKKLSTSEVGPILGLIAPSPLYSLLLC